MFRQFKITKKDLRLNIKTAWEQIKLGIPVSLQSTITSIGSMMMQSAINSFGPVKMAGLTAAMRVESITNIPMSGLGVATQTFVGQNYGAKNYQRIVSSVKKIFFLDLLVSVLMSVTLMLVAEPVVSLFMDEINPEIMAASKEYLTAIA